MYTGETRKELMMNYRLIPDQEGNVGDHEKTRSEVIENILYSRAMKSKQVALEKGNP